MSNYYICYKSKAENFTNESEILNILNLSQKNNLKNNITGMLLYIEDSFIQLIEGDKKDVEILFGKIQRDKRHHSVKILSQGEINGRFFQNWVMGFRTLSQYDLEEMIALNKIGRFTIEELLDNAKPHISIELLKSFYKNGELDYYKFWQGK
jgi:hypothetical protein